jgi:hypothetical protein
MVARPLQNGRKNHKTPNENLALVAKDGITLCNSFVNSMPEKLQVSSGPQMTANFVVL